MAGGVACGKIDIKKFPEDEIIVIGDTAWVKADVEEKIYAWQGSAAAVIKLSAPLAAQYCEGETEWLPTALMALEASSSSQSAAIDKGEEELEPDPEDDPEDDPADPDAPPDQTDGSESLANNLCGFINDAFLFQTHSALDAYSVNDKGYQGKALTPSAAAIPMKSNVRTYGPYASANFTTSYGGTNVRTEPDLCPWVFGSYANMNVAGQTMANAVAVGLNRAETGQVTIPGLPTALSNGQNITLGLSLLAGPNLTSFNFNFGSSGATTSYEFKTFTPKIGDLSRLYIENLKYNNQKRAEQLRLLREDRVVATKQARKISKIKGVLNKMEQSYTQSPTRQASLQRVLVGERYDFPVFGPNYSVVGTTQRTVVGIDTLAKSATEMIFDYQRKAYASLDSIFSPVSINGGGITTSPSGAEWMTPFSSFTNIQDAVKSSPILPVPPVINTKKNDSSGHNLSINQDYLNPLTSSFSPGEHHHAGSGLGHSIELVGRNEGIPSGEGGLFNTMTRTDDPDKYSEDYRFLGLRGPLVLHAWGYDLEGKPIPNAIDKDFPARSGEFISAEKFQNVDYNNLAAVTGLKDEFLQDWLSKPGTWPAGPIDLRWDRNRGVWVSPPSHKIVVVQAAQDIDEFGSGSGILINRNSTQNKQYGHEIFDEDGQVIQSDDNQGNNDTAIILADRLGNAIGAGERGYAFFDGFNSEYLMLGGAGTPIKIGKFCNQWPSLSNVKDSRNAVKRVVLYKPDDTCSSNNCSFVPDTEVIAGIVQPKTVNVMNLFANVAAAEYQTKWCAFFKYGSIYILIAAEC